MNSIELLKKLYANDSKHSNYQVLSRKLSDIIDPEQINVKTRYEVERLDYIKKHIPILNRTVLDIGGNTGFFSFEAIEIGASKVYYYEGNKFHSDFVKTAADVLECSDKIDIHNQYYTFDKDSQEKCDVVFLLNVLHHIGDDYGDKDISIENAKESIIKQLNSMADKTQYLVFQLGFCWKGNRNIGLFKGGTKLEIIQYLQNGIKDYWEIVEIGIAEKLDDKIIYKDLDKLNITRNESLGEFLNRPVFILKSKLNV